MPSFNVVTVDGRRMSPARDLAYAWQAMCRQIVAAAEAGYTEPLFSEIVRTYAISPDDVVTAMEALAAFTRLANSPTVETFEQALDQSGFNALSEGSQIALLLRAGQVTLCGFYLGIRDVTIDGLKPPVDDQSLARALQEGLAAFRRRRNGFVRRNLQRFGFYLLRKLA